MSKVVGLDKKSFSNVIKQTMRDTNKSIRDLEIDTGIPRSTLQRILSCDGCSADNYIILDHWIYMNSRTSTFNFVLYD